jgi:phospholipase C
MASPGLDNLEHLVVLMMENRSFDHLLGGLKKIDPRIDGLNGNETNPDPSGADVQVAAKAAYRGQLSPDPNHDFAPVDQQIFNGGTAPTMKGFVNSYFEQLRIVKRSRQIMNYFAPDNLPVLTTLAQEFTLFNRWFASIPGPTLCNRAFAHYGTSFGKVGMDLHYPSTNIKSIYSRLFDAGLSAKIYYFDETSSTMEIANLLDHQAEQFGTYDQFLSDCENDRLPSYSFVEPNYVDHPGPLGEMAASDQHPDHDVREGERFIASIYNAIRMNEDLWPKTALLLTYDEHGGTYDHVSPPACAADEPFVALASETGTGQPFHFDRFGVRVPAILISPWVPKGTVVDGRNFDHASIPATVMGWLLPQHGSKNRSVRELNAETFLDLLTLDTIRTDCIEFQI